MAIDELQPAESGFINNVTFADASGGETVVTAVTGKSHYIKSITITCISAIVVTISEGVGVILGPLPFATTTGSLTVVYPVPVKVPVSSLVEVTTSAAGVINVVIQGYTE